MAEITGNPMVDALNALPDDDLSQEEMNTLFFVYSAYKKHRAFRLYIQGVEKMFTTAVVTDRVPELIDDLHPIAEKFDGLNPVDPMR